MTIPIGRHKLAINNSPSLDETFCHFCVDRSISQLDELCKSSLQAFNLNGAVTKDLMSSLLTYTLTPFKPGI
jgi:hypothetical protein